PNVNAECLVAHANQPVEERRLVEIRLAVQMRHDPVSAFQHFAWDFRVTALVRLQQVKVEPRIEQYRRQQQDPGESDPAMRATLRGRAAGKQNARPEEWQPGQK